MMEKISKIERKNFHLYGFFFSFLLIEKGKKEKHLFFFWEFLYTVHLLKHLNVEAVCQISVSTMHHDGDNNKLRC